ncbi:hypothetical protein G6M26_10365 [Agrobacterium tumefaciens]|nr:hypothetical protein [Agrobacterium tumefaciens]NTE18923.1 hypothetical protein [Agrobacterium tumefaciens]
MKKPNIKIVIIIPYYGQWPSYFNLYLKGCENNPWLQILFFTDCVIPETAPKNVKFISSSLKDFSILATEKLDCYYEIKNAYKLCDFKPCYGLIFQDYLSDCDYWGYGDIDLIYGDLSNYIFPKIDEGFDVISNRQEIMSGSLSIFKNIPNINSLFKKSDTYLKLLQSDRYEGLDETAHNHNTWKDSSKLELPAYSFTYLISKANEEGHIKVSFESTCEEFLGNGDVVKFNHNTLKLNNKKISYYHYVCNKNNLWFKFPGWKEIPDQFYVTETGFYQSSFKYVKESIHLWRKSTGITLDITIRILKRLKIWN